MFKKKSRTENRRNNFEGGSTILAGSAEEIIIREYPDIISFYKLPPTNEITLDQFERYAIDRLKLIIEIQNLQSQGTSYIDLMKQMKERIKVLMPLHELNQVPAEVALEERRKDHYSHFILRLAFCRNEELRKKFVNAETFLFKLRFSELKSLAKKQFIKKLDFPWEEVNEEEKETFKMQLITTYYNDVVFGVKQGTLGFDGLRNKIIDGTEVWKILQNEKFNKLTWESVPDLVGQRKIFINKGYAYVPEFLQMNLLANEFSKFLEQELINTMRLLPGLDEDDRLLPILENLSKGYISNEYEVDYEDNDSEINASNVKHFERFFPACATRLMIGLEDKHHLRHEGRLQLTMFLKGIGLGPVEALKFWQFQFTTGVGSMSIETFNKDYKYNFRHSYGLEGGRINYKPFSCSQIMSKPKPSKNEYHGCPYRDLGNDNLSQLLRKMGLKDDSNLQRVLELSEKGEFNGACTKVFEVLNDDIIKENMKRGHPITENAIMHPNEYFNRAIVYDKRLKADNEADTVRS